jgi:hypothetical protein
MPLVKTLETNSVFYPYFILIEKKESSLGLKVYLFIYFYLFVALHIWSFVETLDWINYV